MKEMIQLKRLLAMVLAALLVFGMAGPAVSVRADGEGDGTTGSVDPTPVECAGTTVEGVECTASTHKEGCAKFVHTCAGTAGVECKAETHVSGCDKYVAPAPTSCIGSKEGTCEFDTHIEGCYRYVAPVPNSEGGQQTPLECTHNWDEGRVTTAANCTEAGQMTYTCTLNGCVEYSTIEAKGHSFADGTCTVCQAPDPDFEEAPTSCQGKPESEGVCNFDSHIEGCYQYVAPVTCSCTDKCNIDEKNAECPLCKDGTAENLSTICKGQEPVYEPCPETGCELVKGHDGDHTGRDTLEGEVTYEAMIGETSYPTLAEAVETGGEIKLLKAVTLTQRLDVTKEVTLDLNGNEITAAFDDTYGAVYVSKDGKLTIKDSVGTGKITNTHTSGLAVGAYGTLTVEGGTISGNPAIFLFSYVNGESSIAGTATISGGSVGEVWNCGQLTISGDASVTTLDTTGKLTMTGGTVTTMYATAPDFTTKFGSTTEINGGTVSTLDVNTPSNATASNSITVTDGTITSLTVSDSSEGQTNTISITGGKVPDSAADYVESGKMVDESGNVVSADYEAYIETDGSTGMTGTEKGYATLEKAIEAATDGQTVVLLKSADSDGFTLSGKTLTIDLNTKTLSGLDDVTLDSDLTIKNGTIDISGAVANGDALFEVGKNATVTLTLNGVDLKGTNYNSAYAVFYLYNASQLDINGGSVNLSGEQHTSGGVFKENTSTDGGNLNITGTAADPVEIQINDGNIFMLNLTTVMNYVDLDITGGGNAINQTALTVNNSTIDIQNPNGRALTPSMAGGMKFNDTQLNLSGATEGEIRFKESVTVEFTGDSSLNECNVYADNDKTGTVKGEDASGNVKSVSIDGSKTTVAKPDTLTVTQDVLTHVGYAVAQIGTGDSAQRFETLEAALSAAEAGNTITLLDNVTTTEQITNTKKVTLDLNGKTLTTAGIVNSSDLTVENGTIVGGPNDTIRSTAGTLTLNNVQATGTRHVLRIVNGTAIINGGEYKPTATEGTRHALNVGDDDAPETNKATVTINGGTFIGPANTTMDSGSAVCVQTGSTVTIPKTSTAVFKGGKNDTLTAQNGATLSVDGGTYDQDVTKFCTTTRKAVLNTSTGMYEIEDRVYVAQVGDDKYESIQEALAALGEDGGTVKLINNVTISETVTVPAGVTITAEEGVVVTANINHAFNLSGTLDGVTIQQTEEAPASAVNTIYMNSGAKVMNSTVTGKYNLGDNETTRAIEVAPGAQNITIQGNTFSHLRQPGYINNGVTGTIQENAVDNTRGWVVCSDSNVTLTDNSFSNNAVDICIIRSNTETNNYPDVIALSTANNSAYVENQVQMVQADDGKLRFDETHTLQHAVNAAEAGDTITLPDNLALDSTVVIPADAKITLNLNGKKITVSNADIMPAIRVLGELTVNGNGSMDTATGDNADAYCFIVGNTETAGKLTIENGTYYGAASVVSVTKGTATIKGGTYSAEAADNTGDTRFLLNCHDANYGTNANISVEGGTFNGFNPENNLAEGEGTNFLATGKCAKVSGTSYTVGAHSLVENAATAADCENPGKVKHWHCNNCGKNYSDAAGTNVLESIEDTAKPEGHLYEKVNAVLPQYDKEGTKEHYKCTRTGCGKLFTKSGDAYTETTADTLKEPKLSIDGGNVVQLTDDAFRNYMLKYGTAAVEMDLTKDAVSSGTVTAAAFHYDDLHHLAFEKGGTLKLLLSDADIYFDNTALKEIYNQSVEKGGMTAGAPNITLTVDAISKDDAGMTKEQRNALSGKLDVYVIRLELQGNNDAKLCSDDFNGGTVRVYLNKSFTPKTGYAASRYKAFYVKENGSLDSTAVSYSSTYRTLVVEHFSEYALTLTRKSISNAQTGDQSNIGLWIGVAAVSVIALGAVLILGRKKKSGKFE